jgi:hypothetical protein
VDHGPLDDGVRAGEADALPLQAELGEDQVAGRGPDVDADGAQAQPLGGDIPGVVIVVRAVTMRVTVRRRYRALTP